MTCKHCQQELLQTSVGAYDCGGNDGGGEDGGGDDGGGEDSLSTLQLIQRKTRSDVFMIQNNFEFFAQCTGHFCRDFGFNHYVLDLRKNTASELKHTWEFLHTWRTSPKR